MVLSRKGVVKLVKINIAKGFCAKRSQHIREVHRNSFMLAFDVPKQNSWCGSTRFQLFDSRAKRTVVD